MTLTIYVCQPLTSCVGLVDPNSISCTMICTVALHKVNTILTLSCVVITPVEVPAIEEILPRILAHKTIALNKGYIGSKDLKCEPAIHDQGE